VTTLKELKGTSAQLADQIRGAIVHGELLSGTPLHQEQLAQQYGVSRSPIREALRQLEAEGYVDYRPNRGAVVATMAERDVQEVVEIRVLLETALIRAAIPLLSANDLRAARQFIDRMRAETDRRRLSELNWAFHEALYGPSGKPRMLALAQDQLLRIRPEYGTDALAVIVKSLLPSYKALIGACAKKDVRGAVSLVKDNLAVIARYATAPEPPADGKTAPPSRSQRATP
jgi:DNA-binding GntR family transcriptional regulator